MEHVDRTRRRAGFAFRVVTWSLLWLAALWGSVALAQSNAPAVLAPADITPDQVNEVAREIWCPLCSGVRLDSCELKACEQMKEVIAIKLAEGATAAEIRDYFVIQYGPQVLGEPPREGFNWLAWILPVVALLVGGYAFWRKTHSLVQTAPQAAAPVAPTSTRTGDSEDDYVRKLEEELARYG